MDTDKPDTQITAIEIVWRSPWVRALTYVVLIAFIIWALIALRHGYAFALQIGIIGFIIAYILNPIVEWMNRRRIGRFRLSRGFAVVIVYILLLHLFLIGSILLGQVVQQLTEFIRRIPTALENLGSWLAGLGAWWEGVSDNLPEFMRDRFGLETTEDLGLQIQTQAENLLQGGFESLVALFRDLLADGPSLLVTGATSIISTTLQVFLILLASAYFLYDFPRFTRSFARLVPVRWRPLYGDLVTKADRSVGGFMRGQLVITSLLGVMIWIGLSLLGIPLALAISFLAAIFNLVPYLGPIIGAAPAVLLGFTVSPFAALGAVVVFIIANQLEGNVLSPLILSRNTNLHPLTVLLSIMAGLGLLGFLGALLAVPVVSMIKIIIEDYLLTRPAYQEPEVRQETLGLGDGKGRA